MSYLGELRRNARPLLAASIGSGFGMLLMSFTTTVFAPYLVKQFGWSRAQFALVGLAMLPTLVMLPVIGRLTDRLGVKRVAIVGALGIPFVLVSYSLMTGSFATFFLLSCMMLVLGSFTSPMVYTRLIAADFNEARGLALTVVTIAPALVGAIVVPVLNAVIEAWGWRFGYRALATLVLVGGLIAVTLVPPNDPAAFGSDRPRHAPSRGDFRLIFGSGPFWIIFFGMLLCTLPTPLYASQMAIMLTEQHLDGKAIALMVSTFGIGTIVGRLVCGLALDHYSARWVAALSMLPPAVGYALLALPYDQIAVVGPAMFMVGAAVGAEADLQSFLVARHYALRIFSTTLSLVYCGVFAASAMGAGLISFTLKSTNSFTPFLAAMAVSMMLGGALFLLLPRKGTFDLIE